MDDARPRDRAQILGVALCAQLDLVEIYAADFAAHAPHLRLLRPEEVTDPAAIAFALAWVPAPEAFATYPALRGIFSIAAGMDGILACPSRPEGVPVHRVVDDDQADQMAGFAAFHVLWHHRRINRLIENQRAEVWDRPDSGRSPRGVAVGVMGFGHMGRRIGRALATLGYPVRSLSRTLPDPAEPGVAHFTEKAGFLEGCDILINVLPMTPETERMLNADLFAALPRFAALIHLGRGGQLIEADLLSALDSGQLGGASLDVFATEPLPKGHPFWQHPRILVTPHTAAEASNEAVVRNVATHLARAEATA